MSTTTFRLQYLARAAAGVPRDLANTFVSSKLHADPADGPHLQLHLGLRRPVHDVQQLEARRSQVGHDARAARAGAMAHPFWGAVENLNISGGEPTTRNDLPEMVEMFHRHLPRMRKIGINTTGLTPHRAIPMLTRIVEFCASNGHAHQHPRVARRHRRHPRSGARSQARLRQGVQDDRGDAGARRRSTQLLVRHRVDDLRDQPRRTPRTSWPGRGRRSSTSSSTCCASPTPC